MTDAFAKFGADRYDPQDLTLSLSYDLQRAAVAALGQRRGAIVMLDPRNGEVLALASTPTYDASAIADPATAKATFEALQADPAQPLLPRATLGRYVPGSVFKIVTAVAGLGSQAITPATTYKRAAGGREERPPRRRLSASATAITRRPARRRSTSIDATEVSCNIYYALTGLKTGGAKLVEYAKRMGFGAPLPFDLPTAVSQVTDGSGSQPGGFKDDVELANAAYGQAETFVTPLQMALVAATVANDGELMRPRLVTAMTGQRSGTKAIGPQSMGRVISPADAQAITSAMVQAVEGPLGRQFTAGAKVTGVTTAGKSGTAELGGTRRAALVVHRLRPGGGADDRDRRHRRAGRPRRRGRGTDRRRPHDPLSQGVQVTDPAWAPTRPAPSAARTRPARRPGRRSCRPHAPPDHRADRAGRGRRSSWPRCSAGWPPRRGSVASRSSRSWAGWAA